MMLPSTRFANRGWLPPPTSLRQGDHEKSGNARGRLLLRTQLNGKGANDSRTGGKGIGPGELGGCMK